MDNSTAAVNKNVNIKGLSNLMDGLLAKGLVTEEQLQEIKFESVSSNLNIDDILIEKNIVSPADIARTYSEMRNVGFIDLANVYIPLETLNLIPGDIAKSNSAVVFEETKHKVKVAMLDPLDLQKIKYLESYTKKRIEPFYAARDQLNAAIETKYGAEIDTEVDEALVEVGKLDLSKSDSGNLEDEDVGTAPIIKIVNMILDYGIKNDASDIHIEPRRANITVRFRVRGILHEKLTIPRKLLAPLVTQN
ncbi:MAG: hypothetical protein Q9M91_01325 [Candidatus Dojkabacteria bacterium]|nr:hypothetical protein [Candidatus Dojkabacteria bacterium]